MTTGLSAFPLTPIQNDALHEPSFVSLIQHLAHSPVDEITVLGSTGSYAYLERAERARVIELAREHAGEKPVSAGIGALRTSAVLRHVRDAEDAGVTRLLLAPMSYHRLTDNEVYTLFRTVTDATSLPVVVYDNPTTTQVKFSYDLLQRVCDLPGIAGVKIPPPPIDLGAAQEHLRLLRTVIPGHVSIGVSGDAAATVGMLSGCDTWYSVLAGVLPSLAHRLATLAFSGAQTEALAMSQEYDPLWKMYAEHGSFRVAAAIAERLELVPRNSLPLPVLGLDTGARAEISSVLRSIGVSR